MISIDFSTGVLTGTKKVVLRIDAISSKTSRMYYCMTPKARLAHGNANFPQLRLRKLSGNLD